MPPSSLFATPTPCVAANSVPSSSAVTALTKHPVSARCLIAQPSLSFLSTTTPSTVPTTMVSERFCAR